MFCWSFFVKVTLQCTLKAINNEKGTAWVSLRIHTCGDSHTVEGFEFQQLFESTLNWSLTCISAATEIIQMTQNRLKLYHFTCKCMHIRALQSLYISTIKNIHWRQKYYLIILYYSFKYFQVMFNKANVHSCSRNISNMFPYISI